MKLVAQTVDGEVGELPASVRTLAMDRPSVFEQRHTRNEHDRGIRFRAQAMTM